MGKSITIGEMRQKITFPFEIDDDELKMLFSYFLHRAPLIESSNIRELNEAAQGIIWEEFTSDLIVDQSYKVYSENSNFPNQNTLKNRYGLSDNCELVSNRKIFICFQKNSEKGELDTILRQLRNSIAHGRVYKAEDNDHNSMLFEDYNNRTGKRRAMMIFSKEDLKELKDLIETNSNS